MENKKELILEVKKKREFSMLPDSIVGRALEISEGNVKNSRAYLRKYFGVFLTNKVLKGRDVETLKSHISSKGRDYEEFYSEIFEGLGNVGSVVDLGAGVNGFSYEVLRKFANDAKYVGVEASGQIVDNTNVYFEKNDLGNLCNCVWADLFDLKNVESIVKKSKRARVIFMFQVIDALESLEKDFSKKILVLLKEILDTGDKIVISLPTKSISGRRKFMVDRKWLVEFLEEIFILERDFVVGDERVLIVGVE